MNLLFSGATGSGKTTTLAALSSYIDPDERIVTIEDVLELHLRQAHVVRLLTKQPNIEGRGEVTIRELLRNAMRMRPSRIVLGEIRGAEAMDYLQALTSGHKGCLAVIHASNPPDAIRRLETMALYAGLNLPSWAIRQQIASGVDFIVQQEQLVDGSRKITVVSEVEGLEEDQVVLRDVFRFEIEQTDTKGTISGEFKALGTPGSIDRFAKRGVTIDEAIFSDG
jgi:pilus assembly protein CpaF